MAKKKKEEIEIVAETKKIGRPQKTTNTKTKTSKQKKVAKIQEYISKDIVLPTKEVEQLFFAETNINQFPQTEEERDKFYKQINLQIQKLTEKITITDKEAQTAKSKFQEIQKITNELTIERLTLKSLIVREQDIICESEAKLEQISSNQYRAETPSFIRSILQFITREPDEINLKGQIAKSEAKLFQRETRLVQVNDDLSKALIVSSACEGFFNELTKVRESYRGFRMNLGKVRRQIQDDLKKQKNQENSNLIMQTYFENIQKINEIGPRFAEALTQNRETATELLERLQNFQQEALSKLPDQLKQEFQDKTKFDK